MSVYVQEDDEEEQANALLGKLEAGDGADICRN